MSEARSPKPIDPDAVRVLKEAIIQADIRTGPRVPGDIAVEHLLAMRQAVEEFGSG